MFEYPMTAEIAVFVFVFVFVFVSMVPMVPNAVAWKYFVERKNHSRWIAEEKIPVKVCQLALILDRARDSSSTVEDYLPRPRSRPSPKKYKNEMFLDVLCCEKKGRMNRNIQHI